MVGPVGLNRAAQVSDQWIMRLHRLDRNPTDYLGIPFISISLLPVSLPVGAWFTGILISSGNGKLARFHQDLWSELLPDGLRIASEW
jgi:predicted Kef-type K+ transport protein